MVWENSRKERISSGSNMTDFDVISLVVFILLSYMLLNYTFTRRKTIASIIMGNGLYWLTPPYPDIDFPLFLLYMHWKGLELTVENGISVLPEYILLAIVSGFAIFIFGAKFGGMSVKQMRGRLNKITRKVGINI